LPSLGNACSKILPATLDKYLYAVILTFVGGKRRYAPAAKCAAGTAMFGNLTTALYPEEDFIQPARFTLRGPYD
jgi:hypothetical protein